MNVRCWGLEAIVFPIELDSAVTDEGNGLDPTTHYLVIEDLPCWGQVGGLQIHCYAYV